MKDNKHILINEFLIAEKQRNAKADGTLTARELAGEFLHYYSFSNSDEWTFEQIKLDMKNFTNKAHIYNNIEFEAFEILEQVLKNE